MTGTDSWERVKEEVRDRVDLVSVVEDHVKLEQRGKHHFGLCPFHAEDTASFCVTPEMGIYKCFGCGESGDVFSFLMKVESVEFPEALRMLARRVGVDLPESGGDEERSRARELNEYAADCYEKGLWGDAGEEARSYLRNRGFEDDVLESFRVGFAPEGERNLARALKRDGYDLEEALEIGLISRSDKDGELYDRFRGRVMFPIRSPSGRVLGFGGRNLSEDDFGPKYLNSPESQYFQKRRLLYGIHQARSSLRETDTVLIMEGYTDVLMAHQEGWTNAVASLGTAMTEQHVERLERYVRRVVLVYDGDEAGRRAAVRGGEEAFRNGLEVSVVLLGEEEDPDDVLREDPDRFERLIGEADEYLEVRLAWLEESSDASGMHLEQELVEDVAGLINEVDSDLRRARLVAWLAETIGVEESVIKQELRRRSTGEGTPDSRESPGGTVQRRLNLEQLLFHRLGDRPEALETVVSELSLKDFRDDRHKELFRGLLTLHKRGDTLEMDRWRNEISMECNEYLSGLLSWTPEDEMKDPPSPEDLVKSLRNLQSRRERGELARSLAEQDRDGEAGRLDEAKKALLREAQHSRMEHGTHETENNRT